MRLPIFTPVRGFLEAKAIQARDVHLALAVRNPDFDS